MNYGGILPVGILFMLYTFRILHKGIPFSSRKGSHNDKAHPPIHPTKPGRDLTGDSLKIYEFIVRRYLACLSQDAKGYETSVHISLGGENFNSKGVAYIIIRTIHI